jgi:hypothetical protein
VVARFVLLDVASRSARLTTHLAFSLSCYRHPPAPAPTHHQARKDARKVIFKRADQYVKEYLSNEKEEIRLKREARKTGDFYVPAQPKVYFVVRIKG